jgi:predicted DNA-binding transcriptional regulator AlpA
MTLGRAFLFPLGTSVTEDVSSVNKQHGKRRRGKPPTHRTNVYIEKAKALKDADVPAVRLLDKAHVMAIANASFPTIWAWMRNNKFPRSRIVNGRSMWLSSEINNWLAALPVRTLKGDNAPGDAEPLEVA